MSYLAYLGDQQTDARAFIWNATQASRVKFWFEDRIHTNDVKGIIGAIATYISQKSGSTNADIISVALSIFWDVLCPKTQDQWEKNDTLKDKTKAVGYRLNADTLNATGDAVATAIGKFMLLGQNGGGSGSDGFSEVFKNPLLKIGAIGAAVVAAYFIFIKKKKK